jgi:Uma2 family endonuclease
MPSAATDAETLLTIEEFARGEGRDQGLPLELVRGRVVRMNPPRPYHGYVCLTAATIFLEHIKARDLGYVLTNDSGVITGRNPDTLRGADVAFYGFAKVPRGTLPRDQYHDVVPDLVVEVLSPDDRWPHIMEKVSDYLNAGVPFVLLVDTLQRKLHLYAADAPVQLLDEAEILTLPAILPGFETPVARFFE